MDGIGAIGYGGSALTRLAGSGGTTGLPAASAVALGGLSGALDLQAALARLIQSIDPNAATGAGANIDLLV